ncbi:putative addiction module toxin, Txe/YoeB [Calothrix sp. NIES-4071]|nr:putative addiction module toxin, Txe/YoeB [Calothrix sp. NIES-4071]BAZ56096.1 putative addiction module toxin, Txe/YoeB [Calothrix sp. NIES-4105]
MWELRFTKRAQKDAKNLAASGLKSKAEALLAVIEQNPYQNPPSYEKLKGDLQGKSTEASISFLNGKSYLTSTQASRVPKTPLIKAVTRDVVKVTSYANSAIGLVAILQKSAGDSLLDFKNIAIIGTMSITVKYKTLIRQAQELPINTLRNCFQAGVSACKRFLEDKIGIAIVDFAPHMNTLIKVGFPLMT